jgi:hypothetical protein
LRVASSDPVLVLSHLCARGSITQHDYERLVAVWRSGTSAALCAPVASGNGLDEEEYWSLRFVRDLARALFPDHVGDAEVDGLLAAYEGGVMSELRRGLSSRRSD